MLVFFMRSDMDKQKFFRKIFLISFISAIFSVLSILIMNSINQYLFYNLEPFSQFKEIYQSNFPTNLFGLEAEINYLYSFLMNFLIAFASLFGLRLGFMSFVE